MTDNQTAQARVGSLFNYVLIASERVKEIYEQRSANGDAALPVERHKRLEKPHLQAAREIEAGLIGVEYLEKIRQRASNKNRRKMR